jgi:ubiquinone/menaquinone biosynthesis C-methylase UbiE
MHKFDPANADRLENPERHALLTPAETLVRFGLKSGMTMADIGAGTGFFSRPAATIVGDTGKVFAFDISDDMISFLTSNPIATNIMVEKCEEYDFPMGDAEADFVLLAFVLHEIAEKGRLLTELKRITKRSGRIAIIEWIRKDTEHGPPSGERISQDELRHILRSCRILDEGTLNDEHYYFVIGC